MSNPFQNESIYLDDVVKWEVEPRYTREVVTLEAVAGATAVPVVGELLQTGTGVKKVVVASDGSGCNAILLEEVPGGLAAHKAGDISVLALVRGPALIDTDRVHVNSSYKTAALAALKVLEINALTEPASYEEGTPDS